MRQKFLFFTAVVLYSYILSVSTSGCAQVGLPSGGVKDSLAPVLIKATPLSKTTNFTGNKITLTFDEYVDITEVQNNLLVSPLPKNNPEIRSNLRTVSIKLKDTLKANTTYSINFGNAIRDVNEANIVKDFTYIFSTGNSIDSFKLNGKVLLAETGKADSNMIVMLYRNANDSSVQKRKPDYVAKVNTDGRFNFTYLPAATFKIYALLDGDGGKTYNSKTEMFAFAVDNKDISITENNDSIALFASSVEKAKPNAAGGNSGTTIAKPKLEKKLRYESSSAQGKQDLLKPLALTFNNPLKTADQAKIILADTNYNIIPGAIFTLDSTKRIINFKYAWIPETNYTLVIDKSALVDSADNVLAKNDTLKFATKRTEDYGKVLLRFKNIDIATHPVLQILEGEEIKFSYPLTTTEWSNSLFPPGDYTLRILIDSNNNGIWDPGNYTKNLQPEKAITLPQKLNIKANWDNERDIIL